jgi:glyoxylase-like metal-dependent hydrolase (beta-lactamase superfamily II)
MVAGIGTILIPPQTGNMNEYIEQLKRLKDAKPHLIFPSHGPVIALPEQTIQRYIDHRSARHQRVLDAVLAGTSSVEDIARTAYEDTPDAHPSLAIDQTLSHLLAHQEEGNLTQKNGIWAAQEGG